jgi:hypothetical protein
MNSWVLLGNTTVGITIGSVAGFSIGMYKADKLTEGKFSNILDSFVYGFYCTVGLLAGVAGGSIAGVLCTIAYDVIMKHKTSTQ